MSRGDSSRAAQDSAAGSALQESVRHKISYGSFQSMLREAPFTLPESIEEDILDPDDPSEAEAEDESVEGQSGEEAPKLEKGD